MGKYTYKDSERIIDGEHPDFDRTVATHEGKPGRWLRRMTTIVVDHDGQHWSIEWGSPLTENQEAEFNNEPEMVDPIAVDHPAARMVVDDIIADMSSRSGIGDCWHGIDPSIQDEIKAKWSELIERRIS